MPLEVRRAEAQRLHAFCQQALPAGPGVGAGFAICVACVGGFAGAYEAVACSVIGDGFVGLPAAFIASTVPGTVAPMRASSPGKTRRWEP